MANNHNNDNSEIGKLTQYYFMIFLATIAVFTLLNDTIDTIKKQDTQRLSVVLAFISMTVVLIFSGFGLFLILGERKGRIEKKRLEVTKNLILKRLTNIQTLLMLLIASITVILVDIIISLASTNQDFSSGLLTKLLMLVIIYCIFMIMLYIAHKLYIVILVLALTLLLLITLYPIINIWH